MRICFDLDGVIAQLKAPGEGYLDVDPVPGAVEKMTELRSHGHYLIIHTARHMKTCEGNLGKVQAKIGKDTLEWLQMHSVPFDEIYFGKPWAQIYIDDNGFRFSSWENIADDGDGLPGNREIEREQEKFVHENPNDTP